jgi:hypothetical protein
MAPRVIRMVAVLDVGVNPQNWSERNVKDAVTTAFAALTAATSNGDVPIEIPTFRVHTLGEAYEILIRSP